MEVMTDSHVLAELYEDVRNLTKHHLGKMKDLDIYQTYTANGHTLDSAYWIAAHLVWTEHFLLVEGLSGESMDIPWLEAFRFGARNIKKEQLPNFEEVMYQMDRVHEQAVKLINELTNEELDEPNEVNMQFAGSDTKRKLIYHAIRHEPTHAGQLGWILKMNGISTV